MRKEAGLDGTDAKEERLVIHLLRHSAATEAGMSDFRKLAQDEACRIVNDGISKDVSSLKDGRRDVRAARFIPRNYSTLTHREYLDKA